MKKLVYAKELITGFLFFQSVAIIMMLLSDKCLFLFGVDINRLNILLDLLSFYFTIILGLLFFQKRMERLFKSSRFVEISSLNILAMVIGFIFYDEVVFFIRNKNLYKYFMECDIYKIGTILVVSIIVCWIYNSSNKNRTHEESNRFILDEAIKEKKDDALDFYNKAIKFAEEIYLSANHGSFVYGLNAPWGTGKSSFVNLCIEWFNKKNDVIIYKFEPLMYESKNNLVIKYVDGLIETIDKSIYAPELILLMSKYRKFFSDNHNQINFTDFNFTALLPFDNQKKLFDAIKQSLKNLNMKIIVVVDDLDRLDIQSIKDILHVIKKSFYFDNISYILCYDNANIGKTFAMEHNFVSEENKNPMNYLLGQEEIVNFMEKFVNIKYNIILDSQDLLGYLKKQQESSSIIFSNPKIYNQLKKSLENIFKKEFHEYIPLIGSVRKIKSLINTLILLNFADGKIDFEKIDINFDDLIHLLLVYINYPDIFQHIVDTETNGKRGFFSNTLDTNQKYVPTEEYKKYKCKLTDIQQFLLDKIWGETIMLDRIESSQNKYRNACLNDPENDRPGNLERYLLIIIKNQIPNISKEYTSYASLIKEFLNGVKDINEIFNSTNLNKQRIWWALVNTSYTRPQKNLIEQSIDFALTELYKYPINKDGVKELSQESIVFYIASLLDKCVIGPTSPSEFSLPVNIQEISNRIFGKKEFDKKGILARIVDYENNILVLNNLLNFRYYIAANNRLSFYNITESLIKTADKNGKIEGDTRDIERNELREISQWIFQYFKDNIRSKNVFEIIENSDTIKDKSIKKELRIFMVYKFISCSNNDSSTIPCGFYDVSGTTDGHGIMRELNNYFFEDCFDLDKDINNKKYFWIFIVDVITYKLYSIMRYNINNITIDPNIIKLIENIVHIQALRLYWEKNAPQLRDYKFISNEVDFYYFGIQALQEYNIIEKISNMLDEYCLAQKN